MICNRWVDKTPTIQRSRCANLVHVVYIVSTNYRFIQFFYITRWRVRPNDALLRIAADLVITDVQLWAVTHSHAAQLLITLHPSPNPTITTPPRELQPIQTTSCRHFPHNSRLSTRSMTRNACTYSQQLAKLIATPLLFTAVRYGNPYTHGPVAFMLRRNFPSRRRSVAAVPWSTVWPHTRHANHFVHRSIHPCRSDGH